MELKFTFEDGSESIMHYGVKGQQWGVLNEKNAREYAKYGRTVGTAKGKKPSKKYQKHVKAVMSTLPSSKSSKTKWKVKKRINKKVKKTTIDPKYTKIAERLIEKFKKH